VTGIGYLPQVMTCGYENQALRAAKMHKTILYAVLQEGCPFTDSLFTVDDNGVTDYFEALLRSTKQ
jgi:hypothetical protein